MLIDVSEIKKAIKPKADSTLNNMRKADLIEYIRCLENNYNAAVWFNENQARYIERLGLDPESLRKKGECKFCSKEDNGALCWDCSDLGISIEYRAGRIRVTNEYGDEAYLGVNFCPNCGADMRGET